MSEKVNIQLGNETVQVFESELAKYSVGEDQSLESVIATQFNPYALLYPEYIEGELKALLGQRPTTLQVELVIDEISND